MGLNASQFKQIIHFAKQLQSVVDVNEEKVQSIYMQN